MTGFEENEVQRPEFVGDIIKSYVDGSDMKYFPPKIRKRKRACAGVAITFMLLFVIGCVAATLLLRIILVSFAWGEFWGPIIASAVNTIQVEVFSKILAFRIAKLLSKYENHRTDTEYEDSLIMKIFLFEVTNSYLLMYYIAFVAQFA